MNRKTPTSLLPVSLIVGAMTLSGMTFAGAGYRDGAAIPTSFARTIIAADEGVIANDGLDDAPAIQAIIDSIPLDNSPNNRIRILLPAGDIHLNDEVHVDRSGIVIEGQGMDDTFVIVQSWQPYGVASDGAPAFPNGDKNNWPGFGAFRAETRIKHSGDQVHEGSINLHWKHSMELSAPANVGDTTIQLENGHNGKIKVGDLLYVGAANDVAFLDAVGVPAEMRNNSNITKGHMRNQIANVVAVGNNTVTIDTPLEFNIDLVGHADYKSRVMPITPVEDVGFRNFTLTLDKSTTECANYNSGNFHETDNPMGVGHKYINFCPQDAIHGIVLKWAVDSWIENVNFVMTGSHPIVTEFAQSITFKGNKIDGAWNKGKGGNGYFRGSKLYDSLITGNDIQNVRHLTLQWSASGNVVENNTMNVDMNLHGGWERNNIIRNNTIAIPFEHRSWDVSGAGDFVGFPEDETWQPIWFGSALHASKWAGPTGPNNVFYNNTMSKAQTAGAAITPWGLFDEANTAYTFGWDGTGFVHPTLANGDLIPTWGYDIALDVFNNMPNSGVVKNNELPEAFGITLTSPRDGAEFALGETLVLAAETTSSDIQAVKFIINGEVYVEDAIAPFETNWQPETTGTYAIYSIAVKNDSTEVPSNSRNVIISNVVENPDEGENNPDDTTDPDDSTNPADPVFSASMTAPANNSVYVLGANITVSASAFSSDDDIKQVNFYINGVQETQVTNAPYSFVWTPSTAGNYTVHAVAVRNDNAQAPAISRSVIINEETGTTDPDEETETTDPDEETETTDPDEETDQSEVEFTSTITAPLNNAEYTVNTRITFSANATSNEGIKQVKFYAVLNGVNQYLGQDGSAPYQVTWTPSVVGTYTIKAVAVDNLNNQLDSTTHTINIKAAGTPTTPENEDNPEDNNSNTPDTSTPTTPENDNENSGETANKPAEEATELKLFGSLNPLLAITLLLGLVGLRRRR